MRILFLLLGTCLVAAAQSKPVVGVGGIVHETNTFNPRKTRLEDFGTSLGAAEGILRGQDVITKSGNANNTTAGFIYGAGQAGYTLHPTLVAGPQTMGTVLDSAFEPLVKELIDRLRQAPKLDGILLFLHGTMVTESYPHADAEVVRRVRLAFGEKIPIVVVHDFHANISEEIVRLSTVLLSYKECPHLDARAAGVNAARIMGDILSGKVKPTQALAKPPMLLNILFHNTYAAPLQAVTDASKAVEKMPKVLAASVAGGYQYADIPAMGPSVVVVTDNDPALARREADRLSGMLWEMREQLVMKAPGPAEAVRMAMTNGKWPVTLMDAGDNIGGGSAGDSTFILSELLKQRAEGWVMVISDAAAVQAAVRSGVGGVFDMAVGGKTDNLHGDSVRVKGRVRGIHDGRFVERAVRHGGGRYWDMGVTAVIEVEGSTPDMPNLLVLTPKRIIPFSLGQLVSLGIFPEYMKILVAKGTIAPRAAYEPISARIIEVDSGGVTGMNPGRFTYRRIRAGLFGAR
ncbi:MAG: M81 family metallopeptidase [Acidobacteria bacterium]|jgi:microcystin degradation protein MlrC|nr:M81 family metallopeptidase [Bryobacteraceae bacterium CoA2 C42]MCA2966671.1 M81 family metallopeptidase [Acidobacteriaceae bacterium]